MQNYIAASTQHLADRLNNIDKNQQLIAQAASQLGPTNTLIQQAFIGVDARQVTQNASYTLINPTEYTSGGGQNNPPPHHHQQREQLE